MKPGFEPGTNRLVGDSSTIELFHIDGRCAWRVGTQPFGLHDSTHLRRLSLVGTCHLHALTNAPVRYLHFVPTALGYQPRTTSANFLLRRLIVNRVPTVRYGGDGSSALPWTFYATCLIERLSTLMAVSLAWITLAGDGCHTAFHQVALAYGPKRPSGWEDLNSRPLRSERSALTRLRYTLSRR
jgi:hypothetical protein